MKRRDSRPVVPEKSRRDIGKLLDRLVREAGKPELDNDPLRFPHQYKDRVDKEVVAFFAAILATGNRSAILSKLTLFFNTMGPSPASFVNNFKIKKEDNPINSFKHRFYTTHDITGLIFALKAAYKDYNGLENLFIEGLNSSELKQKGCSDYCNLKSAIAHFIKYLAKSAELNRFPIHSSLLPNPEGNSPFKRINLFLRWMVRNGKPDLGLWTCMGQESLIIPLDVAIGRAGKCLGFTDKSTNNWRKAEEITSALKKIDHRDPVRFDFALSQYCRGKGFCTECSLRQVT